MSASAEREGLLARARAMRPLLRELDDQMERERRLPEALRRALLDAGFYHMWVPRDCGGLEVDPITYFDVIEEISSVSGSAGWNLMLGSSFGIFAGGMPNAVQRDVLGNRECILAGQINGADGRALAVDGGYRISGEWSFGSGILQSTYVLSNVTVYDGDEMRRDDKGRPVSRFVLVPRAKVEVIDKWHTLGLCGTGSNDYRIDNVFVADEYVFERRPRFQAGPLYKLTSAFSHAVGLPLVGIARGAIDAFREIAATRKSRSGALMKDSELTQYEMARAEGLYLSARSALWSVVGEMYDTAVRGDAITPDQETRAMVALVDAAERATQAVDLIFDACGGNAVYRGHPLERRFRDIHTARQHAGLGRARRLAAGAQLLNRPIDKD